MKSPRSSHGRRNSRSKARKVYSSDFETTTDENDCRVWLWGLKEVLNFEAELEWGITLESFLNRLSDESATVYFHNLKFDAHFIMDHLLKYGFTWAASDRGGLMKKTFTGLISDMGKVYSLTIRWENGNVTELRDSLKKLPMSVSNVAKAFKMDIGKGEIDYHAYRPIGYEPTDDELDYLDRDVTIVGNALAEVLEAGMTRLTVASDSLAEYKRLIGGKRFARLFPILPESMDAEIRRAYRGGFTYAAPQFKSRRVGAGLVLDVNSLYPYVMSQALLPHGEPIYQDGKVEPDEDFPLTIFSITFTAKLKPNHIPCIQIKGTALFGATEYLTEIEHPTTLMVTNVDLALYQDHYDMEILEYGGGWKFRGLTGMFDSYIDKWSKIKAESKGGRREIAKLHLNSLYGKFASNPNVTGKMPCLEDDRVRFVRGPEETRPPVYTAVGVFVTAYARDLTIRAAQENYDTFAYADTDSLHLLRDTVPENIDVDPDRMGAWKLEYHFKEAFFIRAKAYLERKDDESIHDAECPMDCKIAHHYKTAFAGLPEGVSQALTFDDLEDGKVIMGKLAPKSVPGGLVLKDVPFTLKL